MGKRKINFKVIKGTLLRSKSTHEPLGVPPLEMSLQDTRVPSTCQRLSPHFPLLSCLLLAHTPQYDLRISSGRQVSMLRKQATVYE